MLFAALLAAGTGSRLGTAIPKQFLPIHGTPMLLVTLQPFLAIPTIDVILIVLAKEWIDYAQGLIAPLHDPRIRLVCGGSHRQESLFCAVKFCMEHYCPDPNACMLSHDGARPFVTHKIIADHIEALTRFDATNTIVCAKDTIVESLNHTTISRVPNREHLYHSQTPQGFRLHQFYHIYQGLDPTYLAQTTDASRILFDHGASVGLVYGSETNIKITNAVDLSLANLLAETHPRNCHA